MCTWLWQCLLVLGLECGGVAAPMPVMSRHRWLRGSLCLTLSVTKKRRSSDTVLRPGKHPVIQGTIWGHRNVKYTSWLTLTSWCHVPWRMYCIVLHWMFTTKQFDHTSAYQITGEESRKIWCTSSNWQAVYKKTWNNNIIILLLSWSSLCPIFWVFYGWLKLWNKISSERIFKNMVFALIVLFVCVCVGGYLFRFVFHRFALKCARMTSYISRQFHTGGGNKRSVRKYLTKTSSDCH